MEPGESAVLLPAGTLCTAVAGEGWTEEHKPPGVWERLQAGKQISGMVSAGSHILESRVRKEILS